MDILIRALKKEDYGDINQMHCMSGVRENTLGLISKRIEQTAERFDNADENCHVFVAEVETEGARKVVGVANLDVNTTARRRHSAWFGIMVHPDYQGHGIGTKLMEAIFDLADNWLMLTRVHLNVLVENSGAVKLYQSFGFEIEARHKQGSIRNGKYADEYTMGRIRQMPSN